MDGFFDRHAALVILTALVLLGLGATFYLGLKTHIDAEKLFAFFAGFTSGIVSALLLALRGSNGPTPPAAGATKP